jgi:hypothetical protein
LKGSDVVLNTKDRNRYELGHSDNLSMIEASVESIGDAVATFIEIQTHSPSLKIRSGGFSQGRGDTTSIVVLLVLELGLTLKDFHLWM